MIVPVDRAPILDSGSALQQLALETGDNTSDEVLKIKQAWDDRLVFPLSELPKRYVGGKLSILLKLACNIGGNRAEIIGRITSCEFQQMRRDGEVKAESNDDQLSVFVDAVHVVNDPDWVVERLRSVIRLQIANELKGRDAADSLYLSVVSGSFVFIAGRIPEYGKLDSGRTVSPRIGIGQLPRDVIETRPEVVNDLPDKDGEAERHRRILMVVADRCASGLKILVTPNWVFATLEEERNIGLQITDTLVGPF